MRLHRLTFEAIGPFLGRHQIDFDCLNRSGLFLLEGSTGSGKSTLIDAISFALYGKVASDSTSDDRIRSGHAPGNVESFVDLIFSTPQGIYRVYRTPSWERAKKDGSGLTRQPAIGKLWKLDRVPAPGEDVDDSQVVAVRMDEIAAAVQQIIGLDRRQFSQTVILPQGEFASFLQADPEQRRSLLQRVFGTQVYEDVAKQLAAMASDAKKRLAATKTETQAAKQAFAAVTETVGAGVDWAKLQDDDAVDAASDMVGELRTAVDDAESSANALELRVAAARAEHGEAKRTLDALEARALAVKDLDRLNALEPEVNAWRRQVEVSRRAFAALRFVDEANSAKHEVARVDAVLGAVLDECDDSLDIPYGDADSLTTSALNALSQRYATEAGRLDSLVEIEATFSARRGEISDLASHVDAETARVGELSNKISLTTEHIEEITSKRDALARTIGDPDVLRRDVEAAEELCEAVRRRDELSAEYATASRTLKGLVSAAKQAAHDEADIRDAWLASLAGHLAKDLVGGQPCGVCGATEHPRPARLPRNAPSRQDLQQASDIRLEAETAVHDQSEYVKRIEADLGAIKEVAGRVTQDGATSRKSKAAKKLDASIAASVKRAELDQQVSGLEEDLVELRTSEQSSVARLSYLTDRRNDALGALEIDECKIAKAIEGHAASTVTALHAALVSKQNLVARVLGAMTNLDTAQARYQSVRERLLSDLRDAGFETSHDARAALLDEEAVIDLDAKVTSWEKERATASARLDAAMGYDIPTNVSISDRDIDQMRGSVSELSRRLSDQEDRQRKLDEKLAVERHVLTSATAELDKLKRAVKAAKKASATAEPVIRMAGVANGTKPHSPNGLSLATYVLVRRFEQVMDAANGRLVNMSDGRYELVRSDTKEDVRTHKVGLAMKVIDHATETSRDPRTLSGGEKFYVSLCLALGLADVVTAEAGGVDLGTLFIDEGFGSLDQETLDSVLGELRRLSNRGRTIGVVSHVEQMKQSISERVEVMPRVDGRGSTLRIIA